MDSLENKIAALEREQLSIRKYLQENIESNKELVEIVKELCSNIEKLEVPERTDIDKCREGVNKVFEVEKVDKVIEEACDRITKDFSEEELGKVLSEEMKALAELMTARARWN
ncbi:MAG: hypothetical protein SOU09_02900 [Faecalimonas umbilicata]|uniref:hypothetical protein n=1 Tax=Faecalimonas umbilicata TaxID=1912855 RepID=UPI002A75D734|nr:hypothetical protein [Faecalimonas umbilicata]MDY2761007.1 hypothetical protein [Faecalimonas umbilicata]